MNKRDVLIERKDWIDWARGVLMFLVYVYLVRFIMETGTLGVGLLPPFF